MIQDAQVGDEAQAGELQALLALFGAGVAGHGAVHQGLTATRSTPTEALSG